MIRKLIPLVLAVFGFIGGSAAGDMLKSSPLDAAPEAAATAAGEDAHAPKPAAKESADHTKPEADNAKAGASHDKAEAGHGSGDESADEIAAFKFPQQFFVPVLSDGQLDSTMIMSLSLEMPKGVTEAVYARELKLRDVLLRQLLIHANTGGFSGNFTGEPQLRVLRAELLTTAQGIVPEITDVLIGDIARQDS